MPREIREKGSKAVIGWDEADLEAFEAIKKVLCESLILQRVNPDKPFVLRVDASKYAVGAALEQLLNEERCPAKEDVLNRKTVPVAFMSRKLTGYQGNWVPREQETYAIIFALQKWDSWIVLQEICVLTDHKALENWCNEVLDTPSGPLGRRRRWHEIFSRFNLKVEYLKGEDNLLPDALYRWAVIRSLQSKTPRCGAAQWAHQIVRRGLNW